MIGNCVVCGEAFDSSCWDDHLRIVHPTPYPNGFKFFIDEKPFFTNEPSMTVAEIKRRTEWASHHWPFFTESAERERYYYSDAQSVDLTREPHLFADLPATF